MINKLHSDFQDKRGKLTQDRNAAHIAKQNEIKKYTEEQALLSVQLDKEQMERDKAFQLHCKWIKEETQLIRAALQACMSGNGDIVKLVLNRKTPTRERFFKYCPLHIAAEHNRTYVIELLCKGGVNINRLNSEQEDALDVAISHGNDGAALVLEFIMHESLQLFDIIKLKSDVFSRSAIDQMNAILKFLSDASTTNAEGYSLLQWAVIHHKEDLIPKLIEAKACLTAIDPEGNNILQLALNHKLSFSTLYTLSELYRDICHEEDSINKSLLELTNQHPDTRINRYFEEQLWSDKLIKAQLVVNAFNINLLIERAMNESCV